MSWVIAIDQYFSYDSAVTSSEHLSKRTSNTRQRVQWWALIGAAGAAAYPAFVALYFLALTFLPEFRQGAMEISLIVGTLWLLPMAFLGGAVGGIAGLLASKADPDQPPSKNNTIAILLIVIIGTAVFILHRYSDRKSFQGTSNVPATMRIRPSK